MSFRKTIPNPLDKDAGERVMRSRYRLVPMPVPPKDFYGQEVNCEFDFIFLIWDTTTQAFLHEHFIKESSALAKCQILNEYHTNF